MGPFGGTRALILACGNPFMGDDGFGPEVARRLGAIGLPEGVRVVDVGTGLRAVVAQLLAEGGGPRLVVVVDVGDVGLEPGQLGELELTGGEVEGKERGKAAGLHEGPDLELLKELARVCMVRVLVAQPGKAPAPGVGLSAQLELAVVQACEVVRGWVEEVLE